MGEAFITRRGGGIPYAVIGVTYPSGSVCTCTNGTRTMTAKDTSGKALFAIPSAGTWTVKAVKGSQSKSTAVKITADGQAKTVTLVYETVLFDGADNTAVTGGWTKKNSLAGYGNVEVGSTINIYGNMAYGSASASYQTLYITNNKINLSNLNTLIARITTVKTRAALFATSSSDIIGWWPSSLTETSCVGYKMFETTDIGTDASVDLSSVSGSYYIGLLVDGTGQIVTPRVWLE